MEFRFKIRIN